MAAGAGRHRNAGSVHQRSLIFRRENQMFAMAVAADRGGGYTILHGLAVNTCQIRSADVFVALPAGCRNIKVIDFGQRILRGQDAVAAMTIRTSCGGDVAIHDGASVNALFVQLDGMGKRDLVTRKKLGVAVASGAGIRQIFLGYSRRVVADGLDLMDRAVAGKTGRRVGIAFGGSLAVNAFTKFFYFVGMALLAFRGN